MLYEKNPNTTGESLDSLGGEINRAVDRHVWTGKIEGKLLEIA